MSTPTPFTIRQLTGAKHEIVLKGRALPYQPVAFSGIMRAEFAWYPGNPIATVQMLGSQEESTTIRGMWKDRFIQRTSFDGSPIDDEPPAEFNGEALQNVRALVDAVDIVRREGQLVEVTWDAITRRGVLTRFTQTWVRRQDVEWEVDFTWVSRDEPEAPAVVFAEADAQKIDARLSDIVREMLRSATTPFAQAGAYAERVLSDLFSIANQAQEVVDLVGQSVDAVQSPVETARRASSVMESLRNTATELIDHIRTFVPRATRREPIETITVGQAVDTENYLRGLLQQAQRLAAYSAVQIDELSRQLIPDLKAAFVARQDQDLREVSQVYYDTPDNWRRLMAFNGFTTSRLDAGQVVLVPQQLPEQEC